MTASEDHIVFGVSDLEGFESFYRSERDRQVKRAFVLLRSNELANDVVQDAMVSLYCRWGSVDHPQTYLTRAVLNGCHDVVRRSVKQRRLLSRIVDRSGTPQHDSLDDALARLPFQQRAAIVLRYYEAMSTNEIAVALNCAPGSVGPWIDRGLKKLRKAIQ